MSLEQLKKSEKSLEAEVKRLTEELAEALKLIKELQGKEGTKSGIFFVCATETHLYMCDIHLLNTLLGTPVQLLLHAII